MGVIWPDGVWMWHLAVIGVFLHCLSVNCYFLGEPIPHNQVIDLTLRSHTN